MTTSPTALALALALSLAAAAPTLRAATVVDLRNNNPNYHTGIVSLAQNGSGVAPSYDGYNWQTRANANPTWNVSDRSELVFNGCPNGREYRATFDFRLPSGFGAYQDQRTSGSPWLCVFQLHDYNWTASPSVAIMLKPVPGDHTLFWVFLVALKWDSNNNQTWTEKYLKTVKADYSWNHVEVRWNLQNNVANPNGWVGAQVEGNGWNYGPAGIYNRTGVNPHIGVYRSSMNTAQQIATDNLLITY